MSRRHKIRMARITELAHQIKTLVQAHKHSLAANTHEALLKARKDLLDLFQTRLRRKFALTQKLFYEFGNKSGRLLANSLQKRKAAFTIHSILSATGDSVTKTDLYSSTVYTVPLLAL